MILSASAGSPAAVRPPSAVTLEYLRETLAGEKPATWVVTGEGLPAEEPGVAARLETRVRRVWGRDADTVVCTCRRADRLVALAADLHARVLRHEPTAAVLLLGRGDARPQQRQAELDALERILSQLDVAGVATVVLPPTPKGVGTNLTLNAADERLRRSCERIARTYGAVVVRTAECDEPKLLAEALFHKLGLNRSPRRRPQPAVVSEPSLHEAIFSGRDTATVD